MRLNIVLATLFVITLSFLTGVGHLIDAEFFSAMTAIVVTTMLVLDQLNGGRRSFRITSWVCIGVYLLFFVIVPMIGIISLRSTQAQETFTHDNVIQMELAADFLKQGINPYAADYLNTPLANYAGGFVYGVPNPALYHLINLPGHVLLTTGLSTVAERLIGFYDERMLYLLIYLVLLVVAYRLGTNEVERQRSIIFLGLNPLMVPFMIEGRNDVLVFTVVAAAILAIYQRRRILGPVLLALACTMKAFAWPLVPLIAVYLLLTGGHSSAERMRRFLTPLTIGVATLTVIVLPFLIWNAPALIEDIVKYPSGGLATSYPIAGAGLGETLLKIGVIQDRSANFPFQLLQLATVGPLLILFVIKLWRRPVLSLAVWGGAILTFTNQYFGRYFHPNHYGFILGLIALGFGVMILERQQHNKPT